MGSSIYTRGGDKGTTSLANGSKVSKDEERVEAYGTVDEANSWIGAARAFAGDETLDTILEFVQHRFFNCSSNLSLPPDSGFDPPELSAEDVAFLERSIDRLEEHTGKLNSFIVPGGSKAASLLHVARTVCRRAERRIVSLARSEPVDEQVLAFINRSSDLLFAAARYSAKRDESEVQWDKNLPIPQ